MRSYPAPLLSPINVSATPAADLLPGTEAADWLELSGSETIHYDPEGENREILAIVDREPAAALDGVPAGTGPKLTITVANDATAGISTDEFDGGTDKVSLEVRLGEGISTRRLTKIVQQDTGMVTYEVR